MTALLPLLLACARASRVLVIVTDTTRADLGCEWTERRPGA